MTTEEAIAASSMDSLSEAPEERAAARFAVTASPAPTMSIGPRTGKAGTCSIEPSGAAPTMPTLGQRHEDRATFRCARAEAIFIDHRQVERSGGRSGSSRDLRPARPRSS